MVFAAIGRRCIVSVTSAAIVAAAVGACVGLGEVQAQTVTYTTQTGNFNSLLTERNNNPPYAGTYNNGATELAQYANGGSFGNTPGAAAFQTFNTTGNGNTGSARALQVGDAFTITGFISANPSPGGYVGISFRDSTTYTNFFSATDSATEARFQLDSSGNWKVYNAGAAVDSGLGANSDRTFTLTITSGSTFNATVGGNTYYNLGMAASGGTIDSFSIYSFGDSNANSFWKNASLVATGTVQLGYAAANGTTFTPGQVTDGLAANSTSTAQANAVFIGGDAGSQVNLTGSNSYTGATTINANATGEAQHANALGSTGAGTTVSNGGALKLYSPSGVSYAAESLTLNGVGVSGANGALRNVGGNNTWSGAVTLASNSRINADVSGGAGSLTVAGNVSGGSNVLFLGANGATIAVSGTISGAGGSQDGTTTSIYKDGTSALTFSAANTYTGDTRITSGTLTVASGGNLGNGSDVFISSGGVLNVNTNVTVASVQETGNANGGTVSIGSGAVLTVNGSGFNVFQNSIGGAGGLSIAGSGTTNLYGTQSYTGTTSVSAGRLATGVALATSALNVTGGTFATSAANVLGDAVPVLLSGAGRYSLGGNDTIGSLSGSGGTVALGANRLAIGGNGSTTYAGAITGSGTFAKGGSGKLTLSGTSGSFTGVIDVLAGSLALTGSHAATSLAVASGASLGGSGYLAGSVSGAGRIEPGNSPGILSISGALSPSANTSFAFEMTGTGLPTWGSPSASVNDVLRIGAADPFSTSLAATNTVDVYLQVSSLAKWDTFTGGFFVDDPSQVTNLLQGEVANAAFQFYVMGDGGGNVAYNGVNYYTLNQFIAANAQLGITGVEWSAITMPSATFADGTVTNGEVTQFQIVPEPGSFALIGCGLVTWLAGRRCRRLRAGAV